GVAYGEAFARNAAEVALAADRTVEHRVAHDDRLFRHNAAVLRRVDDEAAAGEALADIVVRLAFEFERHARRDPDAEALSGRAGELHMDRVVGETRMAVAPGDLARQHGAGRAVRVADRQLDLHRLPVLDRILRLFDQGPVDDVVNLVVLGFAVMDRDVRGRHG